MTKLDFLMSLQNKLSALPQDEIDERLNFYKEMIDDRMEEGLSEEEAVSAVGSVDEIAEQIIADTPFIKIAKERVKPKKQIKGWEFILLILGSPIWFPLLIAVVAIVFSLYISLWSIAIALWSVFGSFVVSALACIVIGVGYSVIGKGLIGLAVISIGVTFTGLSIFMFYGCKALTKCMLFLFKKMAFGIKNCFVKREEV